MKRLISRELATVFVIMGFATMAMAILNPIMPLYLTSIGINPSRIGLMLAAGMVGMIFGETSGGWVADKLGLKIPMSVGTFVCAPLVLCFVFTRSVPLIFLIFLSWGIVRAATFGPARGFIGNAATQENKATIIAVYMTFLTVARAGGSFISGFVADSRGYNWDFYISVGLSVLAGSLVIAGLRKIPMRKPEVKVEAPALILPPAPGRAAVRHGPVIVQCIIASLFFMGIGVNSFIPLLATQIVGVEASQVGILFTIGGLVSMFLFIPAGRLADRMDKKVLIIIGILLSGLSMAGFAFFREYWLLIAMSILGNIGFTLFTPAAVALLSNNVPAYWQGTAMGIYGAAEDIGIILGSALGGFVWTAGGPTANYMMGFGAGVLGALICLVFVKSTAAAARVSR